MKVYLGKKAIAKELLEIADMYVDSCKDEYHKSTILARSYLK